MVWVTAFWTEGFAPKTGLSPTVDIYRLSDDVLVVNSVAMAEVGGGYYKYDFSTYDEAEEYVLVADGGAGLAFMERYKFGASGEGAIADAVWDEPVSSHTTDGSFGEKVAKLRSIAMLPP